MKTSLLSQSNQNVLRNSLNTVDFRTIRKTWEICWQKWQQQKIKNPANHTEWKITSSKIRKSYSVLEVANKLQG